MMAVVVVCLRCAVPHRSLCIAAAHWLPISLRLTCRSLTSFPILWVCIITANIDIPCGGKLLFVQSSIQCPSDITLSCNGGIMCRQLGSIPAEKREEAKKKRNVDIYIIIHVKESPKMYFVYTAKCVQVQCTNKYASIRAYRHTNAVIKKEM